MPKVLYKRAFIIALVVGSILNVINQYDAIWGLGVFSWTKALLTYCVLFIVSLVSAVFTMQDVEKTR
ncbi:nitrate/nitrite transporter NrtS [Vibrio clamense]|uniref:nitrate/nitrite transporter NrtS n=1 Tax=Vibrio clamense TaxID=2910254 RepID=UPI003D1A0D23